MDSQLKKGTIELAVLALLYKADNYGYPITKILSEEMAVKETTVYLILQRLEKNGFIASYKIENTESKVRKYYTLTGYGKEQFATYVQEWRSINEILEKLIEGDSDGK